MHEPSFTPLNFTSAVIKWKHCTDNPLFVVSYRVMVNSTNETREYSTSDMNITLTNLMRGEEYSIIVTGRDGEGREGETSEELLMTLEGTKLM